MNWVWIYLSLVLACSSFLNAQKRGFDYSTEIEDVYDADTYDLSRSHPTTWDKSLKTKRVQENENHRVISTKPSPRILKVNFERIKSRKYLRISSNDSGVTVETAKTRNYQKLLKEVDYEDVEKQSIKDLDAFPIEGSSRGDVAALRPKWGLSTQFKQMNGSRTFCPKDIRASRHPSANKRLGTICFVMEKKLKVSSQIVNGERGSLLASLAWELSSELRQTGENSLYLTKDAEMISERRTARGQNISTVEKINEKITYYPKVVQIISPNSKTRGGVNPSGNSGKWPLASNSQQNLHCLNERQSRIERECHNDAIHWYEIWTTENFKDCLAQFDGINVNIEILKEKTGDVEEHCRAIQKKQVQEFYSDCVITKSGALNGSQGEVDLNVFSDGHITASQLSDAQKSKARAQFQSCVEFESTNNQMIVDCMNTALLQNGCTTGNVAVDGY